jgi:hypothetical protein
VANDEKTAVVEEGQGAAGTGKPQAPAASPTPSTPSAPPAEAASRPQVEVDDAKASVAYANFCRVTGTPEEVVLDFGLNAQPFGNQVGPIDVSERLVMGYFTAKRLLMALSMTVQRHERTFGVLETDVNRRVRPEVRQ